MTNYDVSVLGSVRIGRGPPVSGRQAMLVSLLALATPGVVSQYELVDHVLGQSRRPTLDELRVLVSRLRRRLSDAGVAAAVHHQVNGYALVGATTDVAAFERLVGEGLDAGATDADTALASLGAALALWHGGIAGGQLDHHPAVARLIERRLLAMTTRFQLELARGHHHECLGEMMAACGEFPYDEGVHGETMIALYRSGRQTHALGLYQAIRRRLSADLGVEPGPVLRQIEHDVLTQRITVQPILNRDEVGRVAPSPDAPIDLDPAVPRYRDAYVTDGGTFDALYDAVVDGPIVSVTGVAGVGKTRAVLQLLPMVTNRFADGVAFCSLAAAADGASSTQSVAHAVGARVPAGADPTDAIVTHLHDRSVLLVLDTCEHVVDSVASLVARIGSVCADTTVVATTRVRLGITDECVVEVRPLPVDLAVQLFVARAAVVGGASSEDDGSAIEELCTGLDGLPLAIELAAAHARVFSPHELVRLLDRRLALLHTTVGTVEQRNASLHASLDWSFSLLTDVQRGLLRRMGTFRSSVELAAVEELGSDLGCEVAVALSQLVEHSLVVRERRGSDSRYRLLDSVRALSWQQLEAAGELDDACRRHARLVAGRKQTLVATAVGRTERASIDRLDELWADLRAAVVWSLEAGLAEESAALLVGLGVTGMLQERTEISGWVDTALQLAGASQTGCEVDLLAVAGILDWTRGAFASGIARVDRMLELLDRSGATPTTDMFVAAILIAGMRDTAGYAEEAHRIAALADVAGDLVAEAWATSAEGMAHAYHGRRTEALDVLAVAEQRAQRIQSRSQLALCSFARTIAVLDSDPAEALVSADAAIAHATAARRDLAPRWHRQLPGGIAGARRRTRDRCRSRAGDMSPRCARGNDPERRQHRPQRRRAPRSARAAGAGCAPRRLARGQPGRHPWNAGNAASCRRDARAVDRFVAAAGAGRGAVRRSSTLPGRGRRRRRARARRPAVTPRARKVAAMPESQDGPGRRVLVDAQTMSDTHEGGARWAR